MHLRVNKSVRIRIRIRVRIRVRVRVRAFVLYILTGSGMVPTKHIPGYLLVYYTNLEQPQRYLC
jgi:hypothetical protein